MTNYGPQYFRFGPGEREIIPAIGEPRVSFGRDNEVFDVTQTPRWRANKPQASYDAKEKALVFYWFSWPITASTYNKTLGHFREYRELDIEKVIMFVDDATVHDQFMELQANGFERCLVKETSVLPLLCFISIGKVKQWR